MQLSKEPRLFSMAAPIDPSGKVKVEVPLPHWVLWGQPLNLFTSLDGTDPDRKANFKILVQFSKDRQTTFAVNSRSIPLTWRRTGDAILPWETVPQQHTWAMVSRLSSLRLSQINKAE